MTTPPPDPAATTPTAADAPPAPEDTNPDTSPDTSGAEIGNSQMIPGEGQIMIRLDGDPGTNTATRHILYGPDVPVDVTSDVDLAAYLLTLCAASRAAEHEWALWTMLREVNPDAPAQHIIAEVGRVRALRANEWRFGPLHIESGYTDDDGHDPMVFITTADDHLWALTPEDVGAHVRQLLDGVSTVPLDIAYGKRLTSQEINVTEDAAGQAVYYLHELMSRRRATATAVPSGSDLPQVAVDLIKG